MTKRGDSYLRSLMVQGAHAVLQQLRPDSEQPDDRRLLRFFQFWPEAEDGFLE